MSSETRERVLFVSTAGERAVVLSGLPPDELVAWIERCLGEDFTVESSTWGRARDSRWELSERELSILRLIARGLSNQQIAEDLYLSLNTIKSYIRSAYRKIEVTTRPQAVLWGVRRGLDAPEPSEPDEPEDAVVLTKD